MAVIIRATGEYEDIEGKGENNTLTYSQMVEAVGGYIETVPTNDGKVMILDEEGKLKSKPLNIKATKMVEGVIMADDVIVGDVIVCENSEID